METIIVEIRAAEGGDDAKLLVKDMAQIYNKACSKNKLRCKTKKQQDGRIVL